MKKNLMYLLLIFLVIFVALKGVDALEDTILVKYMPVPDAFIWKRDTTGHRTTTSQHIYVMARASDHQIVYCIEPGTAIDETHSYTGYQNDFPLMAKMTAEQWERVMLLAYYGYNYHDDVTDHSDVKWYAVAQYMIWKTVPRDYDIYFSTSVYKNERLENKYLEEQAEMERLLSEHYKTPQFDSQKLLLGEKVTLNDSNHVLSHYELKSKNTTVSKKGNTLEIQANALGKIEFQMQKVDSIYSHTPIVFVNSTTQDVMEVGSYNPISSQYSFDVVAGKVKLLKLDEDSKKCSSKLAGAIYGVYQKNGTLVTRLTVNNQCMAESDAMLGIGEYYLKELQAPKGYELSDEVTYFTMTHENVSQVKEITVFDKEEKGLIRINKFDSETKKCSSIGSSKLAGAIYGIYQNEKLIQKITIGDQCEGVSTYLSLGDYYIEEIEAPYGYELDTKKYAFSITSENYNQELSITLYDSLKKKKVQVIKREMDTEKRIYLANISFKIYDVLQGKYVCETDDCVYHTNEMGEFISQGLPYSKYVLEEVQEPILGYLWNPVPLEFEIDEESSDVIVLSFYNQPVVGKIKIEKRNERGEPLEGIQFEITAKDDIYDSMHEIIYHAGDVVEHLITNSEGFTSIEGIPLGTYLVKEIKTQDGYLLSDTVYEVSLTYQDECTSIVYDTVQVINYFIPKTDQDSYSMLLWIPICLGGYFLYDKKNIRNSTNS